MPRGPPGGGGAAEIEGAAGDEAVRNAVEHLDDVPKDRSVYLAVGNGALGAGSLAPDLVDGAAASPCRKGRTVNRPGPGVDLGLAGASRNAVKRGERGDGPKPVFGLGDEGNKDARDLLGERARVLNNAPHQGPTLEQGIGHPREVTGVDTVIRNRLTASRWPGRLPKLFDANPRQLLLFPDRRTEEAEIFALCWVLLPDPQPSASLALGIRDGTDMDVSLIGVIDVCGILPHWAPRPRMGLTCTLIQGRTRPLSPALGRFLACTGLLGICPLLHGLGFIPGPLKVAVRGEGSPSFRRRGALWL